MSSVQPEVYSLIWPIRVHAPSLSSLLRQGMVFGLAVLNRVYNFFLVCPKQGKFARLLSLNMV